MAAYAALADLAMVMPATALAAVPLATQQAILNSRCAFADDKMRARYRLPLLAPYPESLKQNVLFLAAYDVLCVRGYNPASGADQNVRLRYLDAMKWFDDVERQRCHPVAVESQTAGSVEYDAPQVISDGRDGWNSDPDVEYSNIYNSWIRPI